MKNRARNYTFVLLAVVLLTLLTLLIPPFSAPPVVAAPRSVPLGPVPLYDSGWVECTGARTHQMFGLGTELVAYPTNWDIFVTVLYGPPWGLTLAPTAHYHEPTNTWYGYLPSGIGSTYVRVKWMDYIGYSQAYGEWYDADDPNVRVRLRVWAADDHFWYPGP